MAKREKRSQKQQRIKQQAAQQKERQAQLIRYGIIGIVIIALLAAFAFLRSPTASEEESAQLPDEIMAANIDGPAEAPVQIVEFGNFGCPSCRAWHNTGIREQLKEEFGDQISFTFRHFPVITPLSPKAAEAGQCAAEQDAF